MAQAFIDYTISTGNEHLEKQIHELRNQTQLEFSDCDENLLLQALDEIEPFHCNETQSRNKRKRKPDNSDKEKKSKVGNPPVCIVECHSSIPILCYSMSSQIIR